MTEVRVKLSVTFFSWKAVIMSHLRVTVAKIVIEGRQNLESEM